MDGWIDGQTGEIRKTMWTGEKLTIKLQAPVLSNENEKRIELNRWSLVNSRLAAI